MSAQDVQLAMTAPTEGDDIDGNRREYALRLLDDRLGALGGALMTASSEQTTDIRCQVPLAPTGKESVPGYDA